MLSVGKDLGSKEAAQEFNENASINSSKYGGCRSAKACLNCFHVICDSTCLCMGFGKCPNCGHVDESPIFGKYDLPSTMKPFTADSVAQTLSDASKDARRLLERAGVRPLIFDPENYPEDAAAKLSGGLVPGDLNILFGEAGVRARIEIGSFKMGFSVKKAPTNEKEVLDIFKEIVSMLEAPTLEDKEIF